MVCATLKRCSSYSLAVIGFLIGTEIIYKCMRYICSYLWHPNRADEKIYCKVIFFPDEGILSSMVNGQTTNEPGVYATNRVNRLLCSKQSSMYNRHFGADTETKSCDNLAITAANLSCTSDPVHVSAQHECRGESSEVDRIHKVLNPLCKSTSLIHMIKVLDSARRSLAVCVYLISSTDLLDAIIRAKARGVRVRVVLDKNMSSVSNLSSLLLNSVPVRYSKLSQMMHNKFAIVDAPEYLDYSVQISHKQERKEQADEKSFAENLKEGMNGFSKNERNDFCRKDAKGQFKGNGILMTGSFNWTWSGVVSNFENVLITNDYNLVSAYAEEFEKLWTLFRYAVPISS